MLNLIGNLCMPWKAEDGFVAQLGDFGISRRVPPDAEGVPSEGGTPGYMAPEMVGHVEAGGFFRACANVHF